MPADLGSLTDVAGIRIGHYDRSNRIGEPAPRSFSPSTLLPPELMFVAEVRARGNRRSLPMNLVDKVDAICLSGGSAYGLRAADGVVDELADRERGFASDQKPTR